MGRETCLPRLDGQEEAGGGAKVAVPAGGVVRHKVGAWRHHFHALELGPHQKGLRGSATKHSSWRRSGNFWRHQLWLTRLRSGGGGGSGSGSIALSHGPAV